MDMTGMKTALIASCALVLTACGGGGGGGTAGVGDLPQNDQNLLKSYQDKVSQSIVIPDSTAPPESTVDTESLVDLTGNDIGLGISNLSYYDQSFAMADVARQAEFRPIDWSYNLVVDANGAPTTDCFLIFSTKAIGAGTYKLQFKGKATLAITASQAALISNQVYDAATNSTTADVVLAANSIGNTFLKFRETRRTAASTTADGVTDVKLWRPGYATDGSAIFTKEFINAMRKVHVIRTMDFIEANSNPTTTWGERRKPNRIGQGNELGQAWETMVQLANATNRDIWINVPVRANDEYILKLAKLFKYGSDGSEPYSSAQANPVYPPLKPGRKVYVEYGNEIWNASPGFYGFSRAKAMSDAVRLDTTHPIANDGPVTDTYIGLRRWVAFRSGTISQTFRSVFGGEAMMDTVRPILAAQVGNANLYLSLGLIWAESYFGDVTKIWYGGGGAAYYDSTTAPTDTAEATKAAYFAGLPSPFFATTTAMDAIWTKGFGLKTIAYEGGPGPGGSAMGSALPGSSQLSFTYSADIRMKQRMQIAHAVWQTNGGDMLVYYTFTGGSPWTFHDGLGNSIVSDTKTVKMQALDAIRTQPKAPVTLGTEVPGTIALRDKSANTQVWLDNGGGWNYSNVAYRMVSNATPVKSDFILVPMRTKKAGTYKLVINTFEGLATDKFNIYVNGVPQGTIKPAVHASGTLMESDPVNIELPEGLSVLRIKAATVAPLWIKEVIVKECCNVTPPQTLSPAVPTP
jgi:hypothetical protein